jgi:transposase
MLGERGPQRGLFEADTMYLDFVGRNTFYAFLARHRGEIFRDEDFAALYHPTTGRPSIPPSLLATALVLQTYDRVSDEEARERAAYDLRWKVALGIELDACPYAKSTLQEFRAQLVIHAEQETIFRRSLEWGKRQGYFKGKKKLKVALDTTHILGRGAVKDTYNLLADGIVRVMEHLAQLADEPLEAWAEREGLTRYVSGSSLKGEADVDWGDPKARRRFLQAIVADADRLLEMVRVARGQLAVDSVQDRALVEAAGVLGRVLVQDVERKEDGPDLKQGVDKDRLLSVHDPEMRHGRKSKRRRFDGHKAQVAVDSETQLITAVEVLPGNAPDRVLALAMVETTEAATHCEVEETDADSAYGDGQTRQQFHDAGRTLIAKVPTMTNQGHFPKTDFRIDVETGTCTCPAQQVTYDLRRSRKGGGVFHFASAVCALCPLRHQCVRGRGGRTITVHPQEQLLQQARVFQASPAFRDYRTRRQVVEHRIARLVQLGIRQARYFGRSKTRFQLLVAAAVANLTLLAATAGPDSALVPMLGVLLALSLVLQSRQDAVRAPGWPAGCQTTRCQRLTLLQFPGSLSVIKIAALRPSS